MANLKEIEERVRCAAEEVLARQSFVSVIDVFRGLKWLHISHVRAWEQEHIPYLEKVIQGKSQSIRHALICFQNWAKEKELKSRKAVYWAHTSDSQRMLQFTADKNPSIEQLYRTQYNFPLSLEEERDKSQEVHQKPANGSAFFRALAARM